MNLTEIRQRNELAADIAARVRLYSWQPLPPEVAETMPPYAYDQRVTLWGGWSSPSLRLAWTPNPARLELGFLLSDGSQAGRVLWTP